jgi:hypothetical protein
VDDQAELADVEVERLVLVEDLEVVWVMCLSMDATLEPVDVAALAHVPACVEGRRCREGAVDRVAGAHPPPVAALDGARHQQR